MLQGDKRQMTKNFEVISYVITSHAKIYVRLSCKLSKVCIRFSLYASASLNDLDGS